LILHERSSQTAVLLSSAIIADFFALEIVNLRLYLASPMVIV
jgi:hypothetical protein